MKNISITDGIAPARILSVTHGQALCFSLSHISDNRNGLIMRKDTYFIRIQGKKERFLQTQKSFLLGNPLQAITGQKNDSCTLRSYTAFSVRVQVATALFVLSYMRKDGWISLLFHPSLCPFAVTFSIPCLLPVFSVARNEYFPVSNPTCRLYPRKVCCVQARPAPAKLAQVPTVSSVPTPPPRT